MAKTSITDRPTDGIGEDAFGINAYEQGLEEFIKNTNTPITIALQGEWGSGKTSLMNSLRHELCGISPENTASQESGKEKFYDIWLNTWEFALMKDAETTLLEIINKLLAEVDAIAQKAKVTTGEKLTALFGKVMQKGQEVVKTLAKAALEQIAEGTGAVVDVVSPEETESIKTLREKLQGTINAVANKSQGKKFIFFIDDLDRINPTVAVELLELLKNIFTLENCIFILAIDYDVVIKGLKPKFGELTDKNEREFRSFFDKIIQVPFSMPIGSYTISDYLKEQLTTMHYLENKTADDANLIDTIKQAVELTVGHNPRSIKRLLNTLSLINCINRAKTKNKKEADPADGQNENDLNEPINLYLNFALVCIQIAYPKIYGFLAAFPNFTKWDESVATKQRIKPLEDATKKHLESMSEFNEQWEQILFRLCETDDHLKQNALNISTLLNNMRTRITEKEQAENKDKNEGNRDSGYVGGYIEHIIHLSAVTNLEANDKPEIQYSVYWLLASASKRIWELYKNMYGLKPEQTIKNITNHVPFKIGEITHFDITTRPANGSIILEVSLPVFPGCKTNKESISQYFIDKGKGEEYRKIRDKYDEIAGKYVNGQDIRYAGPQLMEETASVWKTDRLFTLRFQVILQSAKAFEDDKVLEPMVTMVNAMYNAHLELNKLKGSE